MIKKIKVINSWKDEGIYHMHENAIEHMRENKHCDYIITLLDCIEYDSDEKIEIDIGDCFIETFFDLFDGTINQSFRHNIGDSTYYLMRVMLADKLSIEDFNYDCNNNKGCFFAYAFGFFEYDPKDFTKCCKKNINVKYTYESYDNMIYKCLVSVSDERVLNTMFCIYNWMDMLQIDGAMEKNGFIHKLSKDNLWFRDARKNITRITKRFKKSIQKGQTSLENLHRSLHFESVCIASIKLNSHYLDNVGYQTMKMINIAYDRNCSTIKYIKNPTENMLINLIKKEPTGFVHMPHEWQTYTICKIAVKLRSDLIRFVIDQAVDIVIDALNDNIKNFRYIYDEFKTEEIIRKAVIECPSLINYVPHQSYELCEIALSRDPDAIQFIRDQTIALSLFAVSQSRDGNCLHYINFQNEEIIKKALESCTHDDDCIKRTIEGIDILDNQMHNCCCTYDSEYDQMCNAHQVLTRIFIEKIKCDHEYLQHIPAKYQTYILCWFSIKQDPYTLKYVHRHSRIKTYINELCSLAITMNYECIMYSQQTYNQCRMAIMSNPIAITLIEECNLDIDLLRFAIDFFPFAMYYIQPKWQTNELCKYAIDINPCAIEFIVNQTDELCIYVLSKDISCFSLISFPSEKVIEEYNRLTTKK